jgi:ABC-type polysaccharide/polyol phosphate export permease
MFEQARHGVYREVSGTAGPVTLLREAFREATSRQRLIRYLVSADMKKRGSDTLLGNLWWILDPLLQMTVYVIFVTIISQRSTPDYPLFIFAAILPWKWYQSVVNDACSAVVSQAGLIRQIAFPKIVLPVAVTTANTVGFVWGLVPLFGLMLFYTSHITPMLLWIPVIAFVQYVFSLASAIFFAAANVFFRDLGNVSGHALRLWWFLSPGLYSLAQLDDKGLLQGHHLIQVLVNANPFAILFTAYRDVIYGTTTTVKDAVTGTSTEVVVPPFPPDLPMLALLLVVSVGLIALATIVFKRAEPEFAKVL